MALLFVLITKSKLACSFPHTPYFLYLNHYIIYIEYITVCVRVMRVREGDFA